jgi:GTPase SAR1 family protein
MRDVGKKRPRERRVCILGSPGNGELSLLHFLCPDASTNHDTQKVITFGKTRQMSLRTGGEFEYIFSVVDTGPTGCEMFQPQYTIGTHAYIFMFNVTDRNSFLALLPLRDRVLECGGMEKAMILVGNRPAGFGAVGSTTGGPPQIDRQVTMDEVSSLGHRWGVPHLELSSSKQRQVDELKHALLRLVAERDHLCG